MTQARSKIINHNSSGYYHVMAKCVRGMHLFGFDDLTGKDFSHRKDWVEDRLIYLANYYFIEIGEFAVMDNHYHIILKNRPDSCMTRSDEEIAFRYLCVHPTKQARSENRLEPSELEIRSLKDDAMRFLEIKKRICSISWFLKDLNEFIARKANKEVASKGKFFDSRFKSQIILNNKALLFASAYVALNPVRASIDKFPERSKATGFSLRLKGCSFRKANDSEGNSLKETSIKILDKESNDIRESAYSNWMGQFHSKEKKIDTTFYPFTFQEYVQMVDLTGKYIRSEGKGSIDSTAMDIKERLNINVENWIYGMNHFSNCFYSFIGLQEAEEDFSSWVKGKKINKLIFSS